MFYEWAILLNLKGTTNMADVFVSNQKFNSPPWELYSSSFRWCIVSSRSLPDLPAVSTADRFRVCLQGADFP